ncbi:alpha/beta fold hydrolase [Streptomyces sp. CA-294286]|uniref:alpha/beta fold hydrolase n=1 Tax=Streptomyces sp. CA-294286 TaxID=3240070 RepID=UPI003D90BB94
MPGDACATRVAELASGPVEYRLDRRNGPAAVVLLHGGHLRAGLPCGEEVFAAAGCTVLAPSRPGYGRTPVSTGTSPAGFAGAVSELCAHLGIRRVDAVAGVSAGGPTAVALAALHPALVRKVLLLSAVGPLPWPSPGTRLGARLLFAPATEAYCWSGVGGLLRRAPDAGLRTMLRSLTTLPVREALAELSAQERSELVALFCRMRSGRGFGNDLRAGPDLTSRVTQPALVVASRRDGSVPYAHATTLAARLRGAQLWESPAGSHLVWCGAGREELAERIGAFLR